MLRISVPEVRHHIGSSTSSRVCSDCAGRRILVGVHYRSHNAAQETPMRSTPILAGALLLVAACTDGVPTGPHAATSLAANPSPNIVSETSTALWARVVTGETGPGSMYQLYLPRDWNG